MAAYRDFNETYGGKVVPYHLQGMSTNSYFHNYKYEKSCLLANGDIYTSVNHKC